MRRGKPLLQIDPLYGHIQFSPEISDLIGRPLVQRLRHVRLSNIDSIQMPGISNISRFEHSLGTAHLASHLGFWEQLSEGDRIVLQAAALIHDTAITPFGHLAEEAMMYLSEIRGAGPGHQERWSLLLGDVEQTEPGGVDLQIYLGREAGLRGWAEHVFGLRSAKQKLREILGAINGEGSLGVCIANGMDLDNLDNLSRIAFHMGLQVDRQIPTRIASSMLALGSGRSVVFSERAREDIIEWLALRAHVYNLLMLSPRDFCGKVMLLYATVRAVQCNYLSPSLWMLTDQEFLGKLLSCREPKVVETTKRWLVGDLWSLSELVWMEGSPPKYSDVYRLSARLSTVLDRECFAYRITDKRSRRIDVSFSGGHLTSLGTGSTQWLLGVGSPVRSRAFTREQNRRIRQEACGLFGSRPLESEGGLADHAPLKLM